MQDPGNGDPAQVIEKGEPRSETGAQAQPDWRKRERQEGLSPRRQNRGRVQCAGEGCERRHVLEGVQGKFMQDMQKTKQMTDQIPEKQSGKERKHNHVWLSNKKYFTIIAM